MKSISQTLKAGLFQITPTWFERDRTLEKVVRIKNQRPVKHKAASPRHTVCGRGYNESSHISHWRLPCH